MIEKFEYYIREGKVKRKSIDRGEAKALMDLSIEHFAYIKTQGITDKTARFIFKDIYDAIREASQCLMSLHGFKPYSHEAIVAFLRDILLLERKYVERFNAFRIIRNKVAYQAENVSLNTCRDALKFLEEVLPMLIKIYEKEMGK